MAEVLKISKPCQEELKKWLDKWNKMENYRNQESALNKLFHETYPQNIYFLFLIAFISCDTEDKIVCSKIKKLCKVITIIIDN